MSGLKHQHPVAGGKRVHNRRFPRSCPGSRKHNDRSGGLKHRVQTVEHFPAQFGKLRPAMIDDRAVHGAQHAIGDVGGSGNLQEMATGMNHGNSRVEKKLLII